ncbi:MULTISPECIES: hypothetical protein [Microbacterium]|uniref:hypothetical protein n=1 Tax=Microbacterium TaxID=33882 RepID=UPI001E5D5D2E|nr:hypothetical protein [Microbacterium nymphoidis]MCD2499356.1 hypothetical protein [Microbacterium nymphoidis]
MFTPINQAVAVRPLDAGDGRIRHLTALADDERWSDAGLHVIELRSRTGTFVLPERHASYQVVGLSGAQIAIGERGSYRPLRSGEVLRSAGDTMELRRWASRGISRLLCLSLDQREAIATLSTVTVTEPTGLTGDVTSVTVIAGAASLEAQDLEPTMTMLVGGGNDGIVTGHGRLALTRFLTRVAS